MEKHYLIQPIANFHGLPRCGLYPAIKFDKSFHIIVGTDEFLSIPQSGAIIIAELDPAKLLTDQIKIV